MAAPSYTRTLDTLAMIALDERTRDIHSTLTQLGEKFTRMLVDNGRVFVVNDAEGIRHPLSYVGAEDPTYYLSDDTGGGSYNFETTAKDPLTQAQFTLVNGSVNINFPQSHPSGDLVNYVDARVGAVLEDIFNLEEQLMLDGDYRSSGAMQGETHVSPFYGDTTAALAGNRPTSVLSFMHLGTTQSGVAADLDKSNEMFAGVKVDDVGTEYQPKKAEVTSADMSTGFFDDVQQIYMDAYYGVNEKPTHMLTTKAVFAKTVDLMRADGALPDPVRANLGLDGTVPFASMQMDWSRYLDRDILWDSAAGAQSGGDAPILGLNINSLRLNVVKRGGAGPMDPVGIFDYVGDGMTLSHTLPILYRRLAWKRQLSWDKGRRSSFQLYGCTVG